MTVLAGLPNWLAVLTSVLVLLGAVLTLVGTIGLLRFKSFYARVHAPTLGTTLGIGCVLVPGGARGFSARASYHTMGGENLCEVVFDNVDLPLENLVLRDNGMKRLLSAFNTQRCLNPAICLGLAEGALEEAVQNFVGCAVVVSHDRWFLDRLATHILAFEGDGYVHWCEGNFETYEAQRRERLTHHLHRRAKQLGFALVAEPSPMTPNSDVP